ncbi:Septin-6, partial [Linnemannia exigua]
CLENVHDNSPIHEVIPSPSNPSSSAHSTPINLPGVHLATHPVFHQDSAASPFDDPLSLLPPKVLVPARDIDFVTLPGYSATINPSTTLSLTDDYLNHHLHTVTSIFSPAIPSSQLAWFLIAGSHAHSLPTCAFYFVLYELKPIDIIYMKMIHERVNLVPIIAKADTLSKNELWVLKKRMLRQLKLNQIKIHTFGMDMETVEQMTADRHWGAPPFVVSTREDASGQLPESEMKRLVQLCLYARVRHLQEDSARKVIEWRKENGPSADATKTRVEMAWSQNAGQQQKQPVVPQPVVHQPVVQQPVVQQPAVQQAAAQKTQETVAAVANGAVSTPTSTTPTVTTTTASSISNNPYFAHLDTQTQDAFQYTTPPGQQQQQASYPTTPVSPFGTQFSSSTGPPTTAGYPSPVPPANGVIAPPPSVAQITTTPFTVPATYSPPPRTTSTGSPTTTTAANARMTIIQASTGMTIDSSTRPSELMGDPSINTVHLHMGQGQEASQENTGVYMSSDAASASSTTTTLTRAKTLLNGTLPQTALMQAQPSFLIPGAYGQGAFLIPPADLYQAAMMSTIPGVAGTNEYGEAIPDIWDAAELGDLAAVQMHLNNGVSPDQRNNSRSTLLHRTAWQGVNPYAVMSLLISYGANVNLTNENGNTVLQNVLMKHDDPSLIKLLLDNGAEAMIPNKEGMNTLEVAALFNKLESARYLLENDLSSSEPQSIVNALQRARSPDKKLMKALLKSWQGRDGERKRFELMERLRGRSSSSTVANDAASVRSFETAKGGEGKSSKWLKLKF